MQEKKNDVDLPNYFFQGQKMQSLQSKYILELYFRETVISIQKLIAFFANDVITHLKPIIITSLINILLRSLFSERFDDLFIKQFGIAELVVYLVIIAVWNICSTFLLNAKYYRVHSFISYGLNVVIMLHMNLFLFMWILTPGTAIYFKIDVITLLFFIWNILGFGAAVIMFPIPLLAKQVFITLYCVQISMFITSMFHVNHIWLVLALQSIWEIIHGVFPFLKVNRMEVKKGLYFSNIHTTDSSLFFSSTYSHNHSNTNNEILDRIDDKQIEFLDNQNPVVKGLIYLPHTEKPLLHFAHSVEIHKPASLLNLSSNQSETLVSEGQYDEMLALKKLQERCTLKVKQGINVRIFTLIFYNLLIVTVYSNNDFSASYSILLIIAMFFVIKEAASIFLQRNIPVKLLVLLSCGIIYNLVKVIVQPCIDIIIKTHQQRSIFN